MFLEVCQWEKPTWGPVARHEADLAPMYHKTALILLAVGAIPYLGLLLRFSERLQLTDKSIRRRALFGNRRIVWEDVIEYRDFLNYIHLVPVHGSSQLYIDYYVTFAGKKPLNRLMTRKCRQVEANIMVGRRRGRLLPCDMGIAATLVLVAASVVLLYFRQRIVFLGILSGIVLTIVSAWIWVLTRRHPRRWKSGGYIYVSLLVLALCLPPAYFAQEIKPQGMVALGLFGLFYLVGLLAGSGVISSLLPSRRRR
jgi:hypothetical protein